MFTIPIMVGCVQLKLLKDQNIGLISSLALMAKINRHGFIEAPYRKIDSKKITNSIEYLSADDEDRANIAQSGLESDKNNLISESKVRVR